MGMATNLFGFNWLTVCVAAVVSESKKAVSAVAAAVVGVGLLCSPIESVQAQSSGFSGSGMWTVTQVDLDSFSFVSAGELNMTLSFSYGAQIVPKFYWSGIYRNLLGGWYWLSVGVDDHLYTSVVPGQNTPYYYPGSRSDYYVCRLGPIDWDASGLPIDEDEGWIEVWVYTGSATSDPSAYVYDSDGNFYYVDLAIDGYVISGPSLD